MRILDTGCQGKVGSVTCATLAKAGHEVIGTDLTRGIYDAPDGSGSFPATYIQADLEDAGAVFAMVARFRPDAVIHIAAIPGT